MARTLRIAVIGAGIGGLAAALALRQRGFEVELYEQSADLTELGAGLQLGPNAVKVFRALDLEANLRTIAGEPVNALTLNWADGIPLSRGKMRSVMSAQFGAPYYTVHRGELVTILARALPETAVHLGKRAIGVTTAENFAAARFADGSEIEADVIIGSDGIRSKVRESLYGDEAPRHTGLECWRATLPIERLTGRRFGVNGAEEFDYDDSLNWLGPAGRVVCYPISAGRVFNIFCGHVTGRWTEESWTVPSSLAEVLDAYRGYHETLIAMFHRVDETLWFKWGVFDRDPLPRWTRHRVTLLGDAAHPMLPTLAQGAAMAIEDGYVLARELDRHREKPQAALQAYESLRRDFTARVQLQARDQFDLNQSVPPKPRLSRDWLFGHDVTTDDLSTPVRATHDAGTLEI